MQKTVLVACAALSLSASVPSSATDLTVTGKVTRVAYLYNSNPSNQILNPPGMIVVGDRFTLHATFDVSIATLTSFYDADPSINIYYLPGTKVSATIGSYTTSFTPTIDSNSSVQIWNNHLVDGVGLVDAQSFGFFNYNFTPSNGYPFAIGSDSTSENLTFNAFDFTAQARTNDLISDLVSLSLFGSQGFSYGLLNADTGLFYDVQTAVDGASLTAVPEPTTWAMLLVGFALVGVGLRVRRSTWTISA